MTFRAQITHMPFRFDAERGADIDALFADRAVDERDVLAGAGASSPYLFGLLQQEAEWLRGALDAPVDAVLPGLFDTLRAAPDEDLRSVLRIAKRRTALFTALADLAGVWSLDAVTGALTELADLAVQRSAESLVEKTAARGKVPFDLSGAAGDCAGLVVIAMGKMGAHELNYSSDIDLICLFDESRYDPGDFAEIRAAFVKITRQMTALLSDLTGDGYVFRTDLRLRPDPSVTPVCLSMEAAERYYESVGRTWERAALIKARPCAGDLAAGNAFLDRLRPFIWRKHLDFAAIDDAHDMRLRIREHKGLHRKISLEGHNMKLGAGGIREIEFFTQTRQIIAGGRDPGLRQRRTLDALAALAAKGWVPDEVAAILSDDYVAHRRVEHRIQMINDAQTHDLPSNAEGMARLAALSGLDDAAMRDDLMHRLTRVSELTEGFFAPERATVTGPDLSDRAAETIDRWKTYPALRSSRAVEIFTRLKPEILSKMQKAARPDEALDQFDRFLAGLPAGVQIFSLFEANPSLIDLIVDIAATAPHLAVYLGRNSGVLDAVIGGGFFADWPGQAVLAAELGRLLDDQDDYEDRLDAARRWQKEWHFRIGVHQLRGLVDAVEAGRQYADLADAVLTGLWPFVVAEFAAKHGEQPGRGAVVLGMGSLGSRRLTAASDLDLIVIYDAGGVEQSDGLRPLPTRTYFARLTQALVTALSAPMAEGRLYEVDMRLRPSGRQGPVATGFASYKTYQQEEAWTWEHLALTRARPVMGDAGLADELEAFRRALLAAPRDAGKVLADTADMRDRIAAAKRTKSVLEAKLGPGRMQDVELMAQAAALAAGSPDRDIAAQIGSAKGLGWVDDAGAAMLTDSYTLMWRLQSAARLLTGEALDLALIGKGGEEFLLRETGASDIADLQKRLETSSKAAARVIDDILGRFAVRGDDGKAKPR